MTNIQKYENAFTEAFDIEREALPNLQYQSIDEWDSVGHMSLIASIEDAFDIMLDTDDIIEFNSFEKGKEIIKKYDVEL